MSQQILTAPAIHNALDDDWARYVVHTIVRIMAKDQGLEITKEVLTPKSGASNRPSDARPGM